MDQGEGSLSKQGISLTQSDCGYFSVSPLPSTEDLNEHYKRKYFSDQDNPYKHEYTDEELEHKNLAIEEAIHFAPKTKGTYLELGVGEGFMLDGFARKGWKIKGVDFTDEGVRKFFPHYLGELVIGDLFRFIDEEVERGARYDFLACNNVLEHVIDPVQLLKNIRSLLSDQGIARIVVPNDGSWLHKDLVDRGLVHDKFYVAYPDHLHYFSVDSLLCLVEKCGLNSVEVLGEFPIDLFLYNPDTNYVKDRSKGRNCHFSRVQVELGLRRYSLEGLLAFRRGCASVGIGRDVVCYVSKGEHDG